MEVFEDIFKGSVDFILTNFITNIYAALRACDNWFVIIGVVIACILGLWFVHKDD